MFILLKSKKGNITEPLWNPSSFGAQGPQPSWLHAPPPACISVCSARWMPPVPSVQPEFSSRAPSSMARTKPIHIPHTSLLFLGVALQASPSPNHWNSNPRLNLMCHLLSGQLASHFSSRPQFFPLVKGESKTTRILRTLPGFTM